MEKIALTAISNNITDLELLTQKILNQLVHLNEL